MEAVDVNPASRSGGTDEALFYFPGLCVAH